jgi:hypothetical protein
MKTKINTLLGAVLSLLVLTVTANAATQVYDLKTDWSDTQNPNGTWSYRQGESLLINNPFAWVGAGYTGCSPACQLPPSVPTIEKVAGGVKAYAFTYVYPGVLEDGDVLVFSGNGGNILWTAPKSGTINISGNVWSADENFLCFIDENGVMHGTGGYWTLTHNGSSLSGGSVMSSLCVSDNPKGSPDYFSSGSGGTAALQNISVVAGDQVVLALSGNPVGVNFTITLTPDSVDPVAAIEGLAITVINMNLQNGIENSLDSKLDAAVNALVDANFNNDSAACNSLAAFINAVQAQRGKKITNAQADQLISAAQQIKSMLNCGN